MIKFKNEQLEKLVSSGMMAVGFNSTTQREAIAYIDYLMKEGFEFNTNNAGIIISIQVIDFELMNLKKCFINEYGPMPALKTADFKAIFDYDLNTNQIKKEKPVEEFAMPTQEKTYSIEEVFKAETYTPFKSDDHPGIVFCTRAYEKGKSLYWKNNKGIITRCHMNDDLLTATFTKIEEVVTRADYQTAMESLFKKNKTIKGPDNIIIKPIDINASKIEFTKGGKTINTTLDKVNLSLQDTLRNWYIVG